MAVLKTITIKKRPGGAGRRNGDGVSCSREYSIIQYVDFSEGEKLV